MLYQYGSGTMQWWANPGIAMDPWNNLYIGGNWNNCIVRFPYDPGTRSWPGLADLTKAGATQALCNGSGSPAASVYQWASTGNPFFLQPWGFSFSPNGTIVVSDAGNGNRIFTMQVDSSGDFTNITQVLTKAKAPASSIVMDQWGNIFFVEAPDKSGKTGVFMIPANASLPVADESGLTRVDPSLSATWGVNLDPSGNLYISDPTTGVYFVPNVSGTPQPSNAVLLSPLPASGSVTVDWKRNIMYVPVPRTKLWSWDGNIDIVNFNGFEAGSSTLATTNSTNVTVTYSFSGTVTPKSFTILEGGVAATDFTVTSGGTCTTGTAYSAGNSCTVNVAVSPQTAGNVSALLSLVDSKGVVQSSVMLHGVGNGPSVAVFPSYEANLGSGFKTPNEVATDTAGNVYVADAGLKAILVGTPSLAGTTFSAIPVNSSTTLAGPTGVAVDAAGDLFFADSGNVYEIPLVSGSFKASAQVTLKTGLGGNNQLAVDGDGSLYISDPANAQVIKLTSPGTGIAANAQAELDFNSGFTSPTALAVDSSNNVYIVDGAKLFELSATGTLSTLPVTLSNASGIAVDPSGAVYLASNDGTVRIPAVSGVLTPSDQVSVATSVASPAGVSLDKMGNLFIADATALDVHVVAASGALNLGTLATTSSTSTATATIQNNGNAALDVSGFTSATVDYSASGTGCTSGSAVAVNASCQATVTFNPGPGDQGTLTGDIAINSNAGNGAAILTTGVGAALASSKTTVSVGSSATSVAVPVTITVTPASGTGTPSGTVTITVDKGSSMNATLSGGTVTANLNFAVTAGSHTVSVLYNGDRVYGKSTASTTATVGRGAATLTTANPPTYTLSQDGYTPYTGLSNSAYSAYPIATQFNPSNLFKVHVSAAEGVPTGTVTFWESSALACGDSGADTSVTAATPDTFYNAVTAASPFYSVTVKLDANGDATWDSSCLTIPSDTNSSPQTLIAHSVVAVYNGDSNYIGSVSSSLTFNVLRNPAVSLSTSTPSLTIANGSSGSAVLSITPIAGYGVGGYGALLNNYSLPLAFNCSGLPAHATCSFSPTAISFTQSDGINADSVGVPSGTVTVTINTNVSAGTVTSQNLIKGSTLALAGLFGAGLLGLTFRCRTRKLTMMIGMIAIAVLLAGMTACSTTNLTPASSLNTPSGTYVVSVTAQQTGSATVTTSTGTETVYGSNNQMSVPFTLNVTIK
jgi:hypothetical protein